MEILSNFGVEPILLIAQIVNFLIIAYILKRFAYKPILTMLKQRKEMIEQGYKQAEQARTLLEQANEKETALLKNAQMQAKKMQEESKKQSDQLLKAAEQEAKKKTEQMLKEAKEHITQETKLAEQRLKAHTSELAVAFLQKAVSEMFTQKDQHAVMEKALKKMKGTKN